jgi:Ca-activated chloride channel family protein
MEANGGTQLEKAVTAVGEMPPDPERLRMVVFNTDGYAGQDRVNLDEVRRYRDTSRMFVFGIGNSVNRYLIDAMATEGRGDREIVTLAEGADDAVDRLYRRTDSPILTDLTAEIEGAKDLTPAHLPDVFLERPVILMGRYDRPGPATVTLRGTMADGTIWTRQLDLRLTNRPEAPALPSLWARRRIDDLLTERFFSAAKPMEQPNMEPVIQLALSHGIMSEFTSFVAVEKRVVNVGGRQRTVRVPVEMADGVSYDGIFGLREERIQGIPNALSTAALGAPMVRAGRGLPAAGSAEVQDRAKQALPDPEVQYRAKIAEKLRRAQGKVEVQITLTSWSEETLAKLERAGLKIDAREKTLKAVFGTVDASKLRELARVDEVDRILPLEG